MSKHVTIECFFCKETTTRSKHQLGPYPTCRGKECTAKLHSFASNLNHDKLYQDYILRWKAGNEDGMKGISGISGHIRRYLFERAGSKCEKCSWGEVNPTTNKIPLEINHIDGDHRNNKEENLELICPNCHSLTPTFRALNKGKGRNRGRLAESGLLHSS